MSTILHKTYHCNNGSIASLGTEPCQELLNLVGLVHVVYALQQ